ncbi:hypothetical protein [Haloprofundus sp. MHR1]|uniref:hypothetical protein n=1 Tax=Haloprofundus sp. MHR1 TaxID=2572921 RepID=UPI00143DC6AE|nr:hypothetical protein [Haloprofundus sp. MHR1]
MSETLQTALLVYIAALLTVEALELSVLLPAFVIAALIGSPVAIFRYFANRERATLSND